MRAILFMIVLLSVAGLKAQTVMLPGMAGYIPGNMLANNIYHGDSLSKKKWSFSTYNGISTSFTFFKGGSATIFSAPVGLQLNRRLNDNFYAFANIAVAPAYVNFNHAFMTTPYNKTGSGSLFSGSNSLGVYSAASMGLMYINNDKTFSISGSISVEKGSNPLVPVYQNNSSRSYPFVPAKR